MIPRQWWDPVSSPLQSRRGWWYLLLALPLLLVTGLSFPADPATPVGGPEPGVVEEAATAAADAVLQRLPKDQQSLARLLLQVKHGLDRGEAPDETAHRFFNDLARLGLKTPMSELNRLKEVLRGQGAAEMFLGQRYSGGGTPVEKALLSYRRQVTNECIRSAVAEVGKRFGTHRTGSVFLARIGKWAVQKPEMLVFAGDIDFSFVGARPEVVIALRDAFVRHLRERTGLIAVEIDSVATAHGAAEKMVYVGIQGRKYGDDAMVASPKGLELIDFRRPDIIGTDAAVVFSGEHALRTVVSEEIAIRYQEQGHDTRSRVFYEEFEKAWQRRRQQIVEPMLSMEMVRHLEHDIIRNMDVFEGIDLVKKGAKYLRRSNDQISAELHLDPADPAWAAFVEQVDEKARTASTDELVRFIDQGLRDLGRPGLFEVQRDDGRVVGLQPTAEGAREFLDQVRTLIWDNVRAGLDRRIHTLILAINRPDNRDIVVAGQLDEAHLQDVVRMLSEGIAAMTEDHAAIPADVSRRISILIKSMEHYARRSAFRLPPDETRRLVEMLEASAHREGALVLQLGITVDRIDRFLAARYDALAARYDALVGRLPHSVRSVAGVAYAATEMLDSALDQLGEATLESIRKTGVLRLEMGGSGEEGRVVVLEFPRLAAINQRLNDSILGKVAENRAFKLFQLGQEGKTYYDAVMNAKDPREAFENLATELFRQRVPGGSVVEAVVMENYLRAGIEVAYLLFPPLAVPEGLYGLANSVYDSYQGWSWSLELERQIDTLYQGAVFERVEAADGNGRYRLTAIEYTAPGGRVRVDRAAIEAGSTDLLDLPRINEALWNNMGRMDPFLSLMKKWQGLVVWKVREHFQKKIDQRWKQIKVDFGRSLIERFEQRRQSEAVVANGEAPRLFHELMEIADALWIRERLVKAMSREWGSSNLQRLWVWLKAEKRWLGGEAPPESEQVRAVTILRRYLEAYRQVLEARSAIERQFTRLVEEAGLPPPPLEQHRLQLLTGLPFLRGVPGQDTALAARLRQRIGGLATEIDWRLEAIRTEMAPGARKEPDYDREMRARIAVERYWVIALETARVPLIAQRAYRRAHAAHRSAVERLYADYARHYLNAGRALLVRVRQRQDETAASRAVTGASLTLQDDNGQPLDSRFTTLRPGLYVVRGVQPGRYRLQVTAPGLVTETGDEAADLELEIGDHPGSRELAVWFRAPGDGQVLAVALTADRTPALVTTRGNASLLALRATVAAPADSGAIRYRWTLGDEVLLQGEGAATLWFQGTGREPGEVEIACYVQDDLGREAAARIPLRIVDGRPLQVRFARHRDRIHRDEQERFAVVEPAPAPGAGVHYTWSIRDENGKELFHQAGEDLHQQLVVGRQYVGRTLEIRVDVQDRDGRSGHATARLKVLDRSAPEPLPVTLAPQTARVKPGEPLVLSAAVAAGAASGGVEYSWDDGAHWSGASSRRLVWKAGDAGVTYTVTVLARDGSGRRGEASAFIEVAGVTGGSAGDQDGAPPGEGKDDEGGVAGPQSKAPGADDTGTLAAQVAAARENGAWRRLIELRKRERAQRDRWPPDRYQQRIALIDEALTALKRARLVWLATGWKPYLQRLGPVTDAAWRKLKQAIGQRRDQRQGDCSGACDPTDQACLQRCAEEASRYEKACLDGLEARHWAEVRLIRRSLEELPQRVARLESGGYDHADWFAELEQLIKTYHLPYPYPKPVVPRLRYQSPCLDDGPATATRPPSDQLNIRLRAPEGTLPMGVPVIVTALVEGGKAPYRYDWDGAEGKGASARLTPPWAGAWTVRLRVSDAGGGQAEGSVTIQVSGREFAFSGLDSEVYYGSDRILRADLPAPSARPVAAGGPCTGPFDPDCKVGVAHGASTRGAAPSSPPLTVIPPDPDSEDVPQLAPPALVQSGEWRVIWQSEPGLTFTPSTSDDGRTRVTFDRIGEVKIWCEVLQRIEGEFHTVGECPQQRVQVRPPRFSLVFDPPNGEARVGQKVVARIQSRPAVPDALIDFRWIEPVSNRFHLDLNGRRIRFTVPDTRPMELEALARVPFHGDEIATVTGRYTGVAYQVRARVVPPPVQPLTWDPEVGGLVPVPRGTRLTGEQITLEAALEGGPSPRGLRWSWQVNPGTSISNAGATQPWVSRSEPGAIHARVTAADRDGRTLGEAEVRVVVVEPTPPPGQTGTDRTRDTAGETARLEREVRDHLRRKEPRAALPILEQLRRLDRDRADRLAGAVARALAKTGWEAVYRRDFDNALNDLRRAVQLAPGDQWIAGRLEITEKAARSWPRVEAAAAEFERLMEKRRLWSAQRAMLRMDELQREMPGGMANPLSERVMDRFNRAVAEYNAFILEHTQRHSRSFEQKAWQAMLDNAREALASWELSEHDDRMVHSWLDQARKGLQEAVSSGGGDSPPAARTPRDTATGPGEHGTDRPRFRLVTVPEGISFAAAQRRAQAMGGHLAVITSAEENAAAFAVAAADKRAWFIDGYGNGIGPWLGGYRATKEGPPDQGWAWVDGTPWGFTAWSPGEPNDFGGHEEHLQFFARGRLQAPTWNDIGADAPVRGFLVEFEDATPPVGDGTGHPAPTGARERFLLVTVPEGIGFAEAQRRAAAMGGHLAVITSAEENAAAYAVAAADKRAWFIDGYGNGIGPWLGGYRSAKEGPHDQGWTWIGGTPWGFTAWSPGQPDNFGGHEDHLQFFGQGRLQAPTWNDISADAPVRGFLVEFEDAAPPAGGGTGSSAPSGTRVRDVVGTWLYVSGSYRDRTYLLADGRARSQREPNNHGRWWLEGDVLHLAWSNGYSSRYPLGRGAGPFAGVDVDPQGVEHSSGRLRRLWRCPPDRPSAQPAPRYHQVDFTRKSSQGRSVRPYWVDGIPVSGHGDGNAPMVWLSRCHTPANDGVCYPEQMEWTVPGVRADQIWLSSSLAWWDDRLAGKPAVRVTVHGDRGSRSFEMVVGRHTAEWNGGHIDPAPGVSVHTDGVNDAVTYENRLFLTRFSFPPMRVDRVRLELLDAPKWGDASAVALFYGMTLVDRGGCTEETR
ncbi:MAG TPA: hypothetical protein ENI96_01920 [Sedimenticola thiotaurini]|uniref:C-type lectin domain-containing protein n=1 Tax=Sedimenticola thiotaurini TaxID=1543721 RepID=A0A831RKN6_9GAMM|nr:hypothetical protein [Sedimenticola thiotaurini]